MKKIKELLIQALKFYGISGIGWLIDTGVFTLLSFTAIPVWICNVVSSLCGMTFVFLLSTRKTFEVNRKRLSLKQKYLVYVLFELLIIFIASRIIGFLSDFFVSVSPESFIRFAPIAAKICITPFTMIINFIFMKILTEKV